jgi:hypothetical protein
MNPDYSDILGGFVAGGIAFLVVYLLVTAGAIVLGIWITYTIIWKAVRRGLYEYYNPRPDRGARDLENRVRGPRDW